MFRIDQPLQNLPNRALYGAVILALSSFPQEDKKDKKQRNPDPREDHGREESGRERNQVGTCPPHNSVKASNRKAGPYWAL